LKSWFGIVSPAESDQSKVPNLFHALAGSAIVAIDRLGIIAAHDAREANLSRTHDRHCSGLAAETAA